MGLLEKAESGNEPEKKSKKKAAAKTPAPRQGRDPTQEEGVPKEGITILQAKGQGKEGQGTQTCHGSTILPSLASSSPRAGKWHSGGLSIYWLATAGCFLSCSYSLGERISMPRISSAGGMILYVGNVSFLPSRFNRTIGNIVSRTKFVTSKGNNALWAYTFLKGLNFPFALIGPVSGPNDTVRPGLTPWGNNWLRGLQGHWPPIATAPDDRLDTLLGSPWRREGFGRGSSAVFGSSGPRRRAVRRLVEKAGPTQRLC